MHQPYISIIVPVYKVEQYLSKCIESILSQSFPDWELLLIDDGSPDKSGEICDEYSLKDSRIRVFHKVNGGVSSARNFGLEESEGEWIVFVDSDDWLPKTALNDLYIASNDECDIVLGTYDRNFRIYSDEAISADEYSIRLLSGQIHSAPWARLFRKTLFASDVFNLSRDIVVGEDLIMNLRLSFINKKDVKILKNVVYCYNDVSTSVMSTFNYDVDYLLKLYHLEKDTIPNEKMGYCMPACIKGLLNSKNYIIEHYYYNNEWRKTRLHKELLIDIKRDKYPLPFILSFFLFFSNPIIGLFHLIIRRISAIQKNKKQEL